MPAPPRCRRVDADLPGSDVVGGNFVARHVGDQHGSEAVEQGRGNTRADPQILGCGQHQRRVRSTEQRPAAARFAHLEASELLLRGLVTEIDQRGGPVAEKLELEAFLLGGFGMQGDEIMRGVSPHDTDTTVVACFRIGQRVVEFERNGGVGLADDHAAAQLVGDDDLELVVILFAAAAEDQLVAAAQAHRR